MYTSLFYTRKDTSCPLTIIIYSQESAMHKDTSRQPHHLFKRYISTSPAVTNDRKNDILERIQHLIENNAPEEEWTFFIQATNWDVVSQQTLRAAALQIYNHEHGQAIFQTALNKQSLYIKDLERMSKDWKNIDSSSTEQAMHYIHTKALQSGKSHTEATHLHEAIANAGCPSYQAIRSMYD
jgi:hypothetical protein